MQILSSQSLSLGVIGCDIGRTRYGAALAASPGLSVAALLDANEVVARAWARECPGRPPIFTEAEAFFTEPDRMDAVLIAVPLPERARALQYALRCGKPVLCEVPFTPSPADTRQVLQEAENNRTLLMPALPLRFDPAVLHMTLMARDGSLGTLRQAQCDWTYPREGVPTAERARTLFEHIGCQVIDLCLQWFGGAISVSADIAFPSDPRREDTLATILITCAQGQAILRLASTPAPQPAERLQLIGSRAALERVAGTCVASPIPQLSRHAPGRPAEPVLYPQAASGAPMAVARRHALLRHFALCVQGQQQPQLHPVDIHAAQEVLAAASLSNREGVKVSLPINASQTLRSLPPGIA